MKFSEIIYLKAENELRNRREQANKLSEIRRKDFIAKYPQLLEYEKEMKDAALSALSCLGSGSKKVDFGEISRKNLEAQEKIKKLLNDAGYPEDYLEIPYSCKKCEDRGVYNGKLCSCHLALLQQLSVGELSCSPLLAKSTFDSFDLKYYSDIKDPQKGFSYRDIMRGCFEMLKDYAERFSSSSPSFFFSGGTGLGKTHLALAVFNKVSANGFNPYYATVGNVVKQMEKEHFGRSSDNIEEDIEHCDLLILDDLGAEFSTPFGIAAVNELVNNAVLSGKPTIIISNLSKAQLEERYGQRLISRLSGFEILEFFGEDIRQLKK